MSNNLFSLEGRTALVTGSSRGLGRAMAEGLAAAGAAVVLNGSDQGRLSSAVGEMRAAGYTVHEARFDVTDEAAVVAAFERFDAEGIEIDIRSTTPASSCGSRWSSLPRTSGGR
jgi:gluconate 5-dehydrogenase